MSDVQDRDMPIPADCVREIVQTVRTLRAEEEAVLSRSDAEFAEAVRKAEREFESQRDLVTKDVKKRRMSAQREQDEALAILNMAYNTESNDARESYERERSRLLIEVKEREERAIRRHRETLWLIESDAEAAGDDLRRQMSQAREHAKKRTVEIQATAEGAESLARRFLGESWQASEPGRALDSSPAPAQASAPEQLSQTAAQVLSSVEHGRSRKILEFPIAIVVALTAVACIGGSLVVYSVWRPAIWVCLLPWVLVPLVAGLYGRLRRSAARRLDAECSGIVHRVLKEKSEIAERLASTLKTCEQKQAEALGKREAETVRARAEHEPRFAAMKDEHRRRMATCDEVFVTGQAVRDHTRDQKAAEIRSKFVRETGEMDATLAVTLKDLQDTLDRLHGTATTGREGARAALREAWSKAKLRLRDLLAVVEVADREQPAMDDASTWKSWAPAEGSSREPQGLRIGWFETQGLLGEVSAEQSDVRGGEVRLPVRLPGFLAFPRQGTVILDFDAAGRDTALSLMRSLVLRAAAAIPAGRAKFLFIDPRGLGHSFAGFMHLADYDESLVSGRIWAESKHIQDRLVDVSDQIQSVIQRCLRNEFSNIEAYNERAGEMAEPYRFSVIADFPVGFDEMTAQRLSAVMTSGPRCGVHSLIGVDLSQALPPGTALEELRQQGASLSVRGTRVMWNDPLLGDLPFVAEGSAPDETLTHVMQRVGRAAQEAGTVRVPFETVAPGGAAIWSRSSAEGLRVPLGRSGATRLQELVLGEGTRHHVLIAGKTGSGKSTLLHVIITSATTWYGPEDLEIDLIDFKKGVEFKAYAKEGLPHARTIAIESDREFGLSILHRLDAEMRRRGDLFRDAGVQDIAAYRAIRPDNRMPRVLLIVDEFQELFAEDDRLAQDAASLLDRFVRQGRAFGMHAILSTQTLAGAYGLARSTLSQIAVRIALACGEADAHLILSEDNDAARLLSRPGDAIYNDAGGLVEGNSRFQACWIADAKRDERIRELHDRADKRFPDRAIETMVFEGQAAPTIGECRPFRETLLKNVHAGPAGATRIWLGEPVSIAATTSIDFSRSPRSNLLIVGHREESARGIVAAAAASLAAQVGRHAGGYIRMTAIEEAPGAALWAEFSEATRLDIRVADHGGAPTVLQELAQEVRRRLEESTGSINSDVRVLAIMGIERFRVFWTREDDFGLSLSGDDGQVGSRPDKDLSTILRDGPAVGVHVILWSGGVSSLARALGQKAIGEFAYRIAFQMSQADSSALIDSPAAGRITQHRALLYRDDVGTIEKFRPFALLEPGSYGALLGSAPIRPVMTS